MNDGVGAKTVLQCSGNEANGDPYQTGCENSVFDDERTARVVTCGEGANASIARLCAKAIATNECIRDPYWQ